MAMHWTLDQIMEATKGRLVAGPPGLAFEGVGIDSRTIRPEQLFVAIRGEHHDGHTFIDQVSARGVKGFVVAENALAGLHRERRPARDAAFIAVADTTRALGDLAAFQRARASIPVVAITGSNGKTTTRRMTARVMEQRFNTLTARGNFNNEIGLPLTLFDLTPAHQVAVLELGMNHPGEITRLGAICRPTIGVITTVGPAHLEFLGSLQGVARAKGELIAQVDPAGTVVLNRDDPLVAALAQGCGCRVLFFGTTDAARVHAQNIREDLQGVAFDLVLPSERVAVQLRTPGRFMGTSALAAAAAGHLAGVPARQIKAGLEAFRPDKGRLHVVTTPRGVSIIDDTYNANPASMAAAFDTLTALRKAAPGIIVMGEMLELGEQAEALHRQTGARAAACGADRLYACGRYAHAVRQGAQEAGMAGAKVFTGTKEAIVGDLTAHLAPGHWLLVKGSRGAAMETVVAAIRQWAEGEAGCSETVRRSSDPGRL
jgi:UDP-N-acetylmuramoyl-tripeptide--D-alanyl-D-alanine ligase